MVSAGFDEVADKLDDIATFATSMQVIGTLHLLTILVYGMYANFPPGLSTWLCSLCLGGGSLANRALKEHRSEGGVHLSRVEAPTKGKTVVVQEEKDSASMLNKSVKSERL